MGLESRHVVPSNPAFGLTYHSALIRDARGRNVSWLSKSGKPECSQEGILDPVQTRKRRKTPIFSIFNIFGEFSESPLMLKMKVTVLSKVRARGVEQTTNHKPNNYCDFSYVQTNMYVCKVKQNRRLGGALRLSSFSQTQPTFGHQGINFRLKSKKNKKGCLKNRNSVWWERMITVGVGGHANHATL